MPFGAFVFAVVISFFPGHTFDGEDGFFTDRGAIVGRALGADEVEGLLGALFFREPKGLRSSFGSNVSRRWFREGDWFWLELSERRAGRVCRLGIRV